MKKWLDNYFIITGNHSTIKRELYSGLTTFITVAYIIVVNPAILEVAGIPRGPSMVATILSAAVGTLLMGLYAKRPFVIAPYMGENAFIAYTVVKVLGYSWQTALGAIFIGGVLFVLLTLLKIRSWFVQAIPASLKYAFAVGIGFFLTLIGLVTTGLVTVGVPGAPLTAGTFTSSTSLLAIGGFLLISTLTIRKVPGGILLGMTVITFLGYLTGITPLPKTFFSPPPSLGPIFLHLDIAGACTWGFFSVILTVFIMDFVDTMGTLIGLSARAGMLDEHGNLPEIEKPMLADALATVAAALLGTTTTGTFIESAAGIEAGGRTGLTAVTAALLFLTGLFCAPFITSIPAYAYGPTLIVVGSLMISAIEHIDFHDYTEWLPSFITIVLMCFTYNLGIGITAGFMVYPLLKLLTGRVREVHPGMWGLFALASLFYCFFPFHGS
ncbi:MAG: NCS2 family permease [Deltaproteobacteria bacterium]|nr:NCS2 family permease [Candidatus Anaeroferrophillus wilburensis]MBN2889066.1 NCS2 family permease [Deltaproteobacteria bacterium]